MHIHKYMHTYSQCMCVYRYMFLSFLIMMLFSRFCCPLLKVRNPSFQQNVAFLRVGHGQPGAQAEDVVCGEGGQEWRWGVILLFGGQGMFAQWGTPSILE